MRVLILCRGVQQVRLVEFGPENLILPKPTSRHLWTKPTRSIYSIWVGFGLDGSMLVQIRSCVTIAIEGNTPLP